MRKGIIAIMALAAIIEVSAASPKFDKYFNDSTLRLDYVFGADSLRSHVMISKQSVTPGWYGRRHNLDSLPLYGTGRITVIDEASGDTIYRHSFGSLFQEWLSTDEAVTDSRAFENVYLVPQPRRAAKIDIQLSDNRLNIIAGMSHRYSPDDVLVRRPSKDTMVTPHRYIHYGADPKQAIDIAILAEGYIEAEMDSFYHHAQIAADEILSYEPFRQYGDKINFIAVASSSCDSGVSIPKNNDWRSTAFSSHFSTFYSDRYLTTGNVFDIHDALSSIPYEHIIILANTEEYGGGGIYNSYTLTSALHPTFRPVVVHEFGHSFGGLADEYFYDDDVMMGCYPLDVEPWEPNITTLVDFSAKWAPIVPEGTPIPTPIELKEKYSLGAFEGGGYSSKGVYRPVDECRMRNNTYPTFCPACTRAIDTLIRFYINK